MQSSMDTKRHTLTLEIIKRVHNKLCVSSKNAIFHAELIDFP